MSCDLKNEEIVNLKKKCELLRKKLKDSVIKLSEYAAIHSCCDELDSLDDSNSIGEKGDIDETTGEL